MSKSHGSRTTFSGVILALAAMMLGTAPGTPALAQSTTAPLPVVAACDPGDWVAAKLGRPALLGAFGVEEPALLVLTGGALVASGSPAEAGCAYPLAMLAAAGVDVVNLAHRDLTGDAATLAAAIRAAPVRFVSANLRLPEGTPAPWERCAILERGGVRTALVGVAEPSASMAAPGSGAIAGLRVSDPAAALREVLAELKGKADRVVVLADGSPVRVAAWLKDAPGVDLVLFSGRGGTADLPGTPVPCVAAPPGGEVWTAVGPAAEAPRRVLLVEPEKPAAEYARAAAATGLEADDLELREPTTPPEPAEGPRLAALRPGETHVLSARATNRATSLALRSVALLDGFGGETAPEGHRFLVVATRWENRLTPQVAREQLVPVAYRIPNLSDHLYAVADGRTLLRQADVPGLAGTLRWGELTLPLPGSTAEGRLLFLVSKDQPLAALELRFYDFAHGPMVLPIVRLPEPPAAAPVLCRARNEVLEMAVHDRQSTAQPDGTVLVSIELRARSLLTIEGDATAFDPKARPGTRLQIGTVADWTDWRRHTQLLVDGEYAHAPLDPVELGDAPRFLPDVTTGAVLRFRVPAAHRTEKLVCGMPNARLPGGEVIRPRPIVLAWEPADAGAPARPAALSIEDDVFVVVVTGQRLGAAYGLPHALALDITVTNRGAEPETFQPLAQLACVDSRGDKHGLEETAALAGHPPLAALWIPPGERRSFEAVFALPAGEKTPRLGYRGVSMAQVYDLAPGAAPTAVAAGDRPAPEPPAPEVPAAPAPAAPPPEVPPLGGSPVAGFKPSTVDVGGAQLSLLDARLAQECLGTKAESGTAFLLVQTRWHRTGDADWRSGGLSSHLYLHWRGRFLQDVWQGCWNRPGFLPSSIDLHRETTTLVCTVAFRLAATDVNGSSLVFSMRAGPTVTLPLARPLADAPALPVLAEAENEVLCVRLHGFVEPDKTLLEAVRRSVGEEKQLVALRVSASAKQRALMFNYIDRGAQLVAGGDFPCPPFFLGSEYGSAGWPVWPRSLRLLPGVAEHGLILYGVPDPALSLALEIDLQDVKADDGKPVEALPIRLDVRAGTAWLAPAPLARMESQEWAFELIGARKAGADDYPSVAVDVRLTRLDRAAAKTVEQGGVALVDQTARLMSTPSDTTRFTTGSQIHFPAGAVRRFERLFRLPDCGSRLWLRGGELVPGSLIPLPNPWVAEEQARLAARTPLEVLRSEKNAVPYTAPPLGPEPQPKGIDGVGVTAKEINEAIRKGARFLMKGHAEGFDPRSHEAPLVILALLHSRELPKDPALYAKAVACLERHEFTYSYDAALTIMGLVWVDPNRHRPRIQRIAQVLVDGQCVEGSWSYLGEQLKAVKPEAAPGKEGAAAGAAGIEVLGGEPIPGWPGTEKAEPVALKRERPWERLGGDYSCSQYAILGLLAADSAGVRAPRETWEHALRWYVDGHNPGRGWGYGQRHTTTGSMTTAGLAGLAVTCFRLGETSPEAERALAEGVDWLGRNFRLDANPSSNSYHFYYLYGLERAGRLLGKEFLGAREWYPEGARYLVKTQAADGSWTGNSTEDPVLDTSYALLFLTLATEKLGAKETLPTGPGMLAVKAGGLGGSVLFILDASGSMGANLGQETRFAAARRVVLEVLGASGAGMEVALRVYGHRYTALKPEADQDSELVVGFGAPDRPELAAALAKLRFRGKTPLTHSLKEALGDLRRAAHAERRVVLLTDGLESTRHADPVAASAALKAAGARLDVVGLCVDNREALERMAVAGGGRCYAADDADQLLAAIRSAVIGTVPFRVLDGQGKRVAGGETGAEIPLPAGPYTVEIDLPDGTRQVRTWVHQERTTTITVRPNR
ncbi:MAG: VWA domain-containing protein [Planctomycetes bacterium]|nr:VWA domain-containing protein [Planctomycetota bacterium]